ncbi:MAG: cytochrome c oxidase assembly protein, partial [Brevundimonas sp.]
MSPQPTTSRKKLNRNARMGILCAGIFFTMVGAAFAAVPLYRAFCQATGYDGTVQRGGVAPTKISDRTVSV